MLNKVSVKYIAPLAIFVAMAILFWRGLSENPTVVPSPLIGKPVPNFSSPSLLFPQKNLTNKIFLGHVSILNVWASWCYSCRAEHPVLMNAKLEDNAIIYGLDYKDKSQAAISWLKKEGNPFQSIINDPKGQLAINFGVYGTPETFLIDKKGIIRYKYIGPISPEVWKDDFLPRIKTLQQL